jgi:hypothetical protein
MELNYINVLLAFWIVTVCMAMTRLWWPALQLLEILNPSALVIKWKVLSAIIFLIMALIFAPVLLPSILIERYRIEFITSYIGAVK